VDFFDLKGVVVGALERLHIPDYTFERVTDYPYHPGIAAELRIAGQPVGTLGQLHPDVIDAFDLDARKVFAAEFDLAPWIAAARSQYAFRPISRFPALRQDLALVVDESVPSEDVERAIEEAAGPLLTDIRLFDVYRGEQLGEGKKSLAYQLAFCAADRSMEEEEVNAIRDGMLPDLENKLGAKIR
jgi:phenylalanyl-tRNA synthetase beta chain